MNLYGPMTAVTQEKHQVPPNVGPSGVNPFFLRGMMKGRAARFVQIRRIPPPEGGEGFVIVCPLLCIWREFLQGGKFLVVDEEEQC